MSKTLIIALITLGVLLTLGIVFIIAQNPNKTINPIVSTTTPTVSNTSDKKINQELPSKSIDGLQEIVPGEYKNQIVNTSTNTGLDISEQKVEDNVDDAGVAVDDNIQFKITNNSTKTMSDFEVFYSILDKTTQKKESYYKKLNGLSIPAGQSSTIHFDSSKSTNHFLLNTESLFYKSTNELDLNLTLSTPNFKPASFQILKHSSAGEVKGN